MDLDDESFQGVYIVFDFSIGFDVDGDDIGDVALQILAMLFVLVEFSTGFRRNGFAVTVIV